MGLTGTTTPFRLTLDAAGRGTCTLDGQDVSASVSAVVLDTRDQHTTLTLLASNVAGIVEGQGIIHVVSPPSPGDVMAATAGWLEALDPTALDIEVDARLTALGDSPTAVLLQVLVELAREASDG